MSPTSSEMSSLNRTKGLGAVAFAMLVALVAGCSDNGTTAAPAGSGSPPVTAIIGPAGGTVTGPDGVQVVIPAGALSADTTIGIALSSAGAPAPLQEGNAPAGPIYEFTPHDLVFNTPVTLRIPIPPNAVSAEVFMASLGEDWQVNNATPVNGFAEWQRNSLSFGMTGSFCAPPVGAPYPCVYPKVGSTVAATPSAAITQITSPGTFFSGGEGTWRVNPPGGTVSMTLHYLAAPDCSDGAGAGALTGHVKLIRLNPAVPLNTPGRVTTLFDQTVALTLTSITAPTNSFSGGGPGLRGVGSTTVDVSAHLGDATNAFGFTFSCQRPGRPVITGGDLITIIGPMAAPATYTIGGTVSGLTGTGLVLRNNGGDDESVPANATAFTFNTAIAAGTGYSASVFAQPSGQTCAVQNGTGTANANVTNVAVSCSTGSTKAWQGAALLDVDTGEALGPQIAFDANGNALAVWYQPLGGTYKIWARRYMPSTGWGTVEQIPTTDNTFDYRAPQIAFDANGDAIVVFEGDGGDRPSIWAARYTALGTSWGSVTQLATDGGSPQIAIDSSGNAMVVWAEGLGGATDIVATRYAATTGTWQGPGPIEAGAGSANGPQIAVDASGNAMAVWSQWNGSTRFEIRANRYAAGTGWGAASSIDTGANFGAERPQVASDAAGNIMAVWQQSDGTAPSIYSNRYSAGSWGSAALVETSANFAEQSAIAMNGNGETIVVWKEADANAFHSIWARRYVAGVGGTAARIDGGTQFTSSGFPEIAIDASGNAMAVWGQSGNIWANRYMAGTGWGVAALIDNTAAGGSSGEPQIAVDRNTGDAAAVWVRVGISAPADIWGNVFR